MPLKFPSKEEGPGWMIDDLWFESIDSAIHHMFNFCGCGAPNDNIRYIKNGLQSVKAQKSGYENEHTLFLRYWMDSQGLTEHGGSVGHGWLTDDGDRLLSLILEHFPDPPNTVGDGCPQNPVSMDSGLLQDDKHEA